jgi:uncharacterized protein (TIGR02145 family)
MNHKVKDPLAIIIIAISLLTGCRKKEELPVVSTVSVTDIIGSQATCLGEVLNEGGSAILTRGVCWSTETAPTIADSKTVDSTSAESFSGNLTGLSGNMMYYVRAYATNHSGTGYGESIEFTSFGQAPVATVLPATKINQASATLNANVNTNNLPTTVTFEYGMTDSYEKSLNASAIPLTRGTSTVSATITGLTSGTFYHFRIKAVNSLGTTYGDAMSFTTKLSDVEGNIYNVVRIGSQVWMKENLKTSRFNNSELIGTTFSPTMDITGEVKPEYQWDSNMGGYGRQYTYYTITDDRKVCPAGWHVPTDDEWTILTDYLSNNGYGYKGTGTDIAKSLAATSGWMDDLAEGNIGNDQSKNNSSGFTGLGGGGRYANGVQSFVGLHGIWATSTENSETSAFFRCIGYVPRQVFRGVFSKSYGLYVRCLRN